MPSTAVANIGARSRFDITAISHPTISARHIQWRKWRLTYEGGDRFIWAYLQQFTTREDMNEFKQRKRMTYCPAFAKNALKKVRNTVFRRSREITRTGGPDSYKTACTGVEGGVDKAGSSMNYFMGVKVLDELLKMSVVGIYTDRPRLRINDGGGVTLLESKEKRPYCYLYQAEQIRSWTSHPDDPTEFTSVLLVDRNFTYDEGTNLPIGEADQYRLLYLKDTPDGPRVFVKFYNDASETMNWLGQPAPEFYTDDGDPAEYEEQIGDLDRIPFVLLDIGNSLLADVCNYQIAHLNIASSDIWYAARANFPFYTEAYDPRSDSLHIRHENQESSDSYNPFNTTLSTTNSAQIDVGPTHGRRYPQGTDRPGFIHPSSEPLTASMAKQDQMKDEIRELVDMTLQSLTGDAGAEGILSGLNYIAYILQWAENKLASYWSMYENNDEPAIVIYPETPEITDPKDIQLEIENLLLLIDKVPQLTFKKTLLKKVARIKLSSDTSYEEIEKIYQEIDKSKVVLGDPLNIKNDVESGLVSLETACVARGYEKEEADKAAEDHAAKLRRIQDAQTPKIDQTQTLIASGHARGLVDQSGNPQAGPQEKQQVKNNLKEQQNPEDPTRSKDVTKPLTADKTLKPKE